MYFPVLYSFLLCIGLFLFIKMKENKEGVGFSEYFFSRFITKVKFRNHAKLVIRKKSRIRDFINGLMGDINVIKITDDIEIITDNLSLKILRLNSSMQEKVNRILSEKGVKNIVFTNGFVKLEVSLFYKNEILEKKGELVEKFEDDLGHIANFVEMFIQKAPKNSLTSREKESKSYLDYVSFKSIQYALLVSNLFYLLYTQIYNINSVYLLNNFDLNYFYIILGTIIIIISWFFFIKFLLSDSIWSIKLIREFLIVFLVSIFFSINSLYLFNVIFDFNKKEYSLNNYETKIINSNGFRIYQIRIDNKNKENKNLDKAYVNISVNKKDFDSLRLKEGKEKVFISVGLGSLNMGYIDYISNISDFNYYLK